MNLQKVDVRAIQCGTRREMCRTAAVEKLAASIIECGGLVKPLILAASGISGNGEQKFTVAEVSATHYWAAVRAREIAAEKCETVNAFVFRDAAAATAAAAQLLIS